jgi:hypothetical protein
LVRGARGLLLKVTFSCRSVLHPSLARFFS